MTYGEFKNSHDHFTVDEYANVKTVEELEEIKTEIKDLDLEFFDEDYRSGIARGIMEFNKILNKHIRELKGDNNDK